MRKPSRNAWPAACAARAKKRLRTGQPSVTDQPPPSTFPGPKRKPLPGQLDLFGNQAVRAETPTE